MIVQNPKLQIAGFAIGVFASITTIFANIPRIVDFAYNTCHLIGWCKQTEPSDMLKSCPFALPPGEAPGQDCAR